jgi:histidyl-tRNA synthetase
VSEGAKKKEEKPRKFQAIRGTRDLLPPETALWNRVEQTAREVFSTFGFGEIRPPMFEATEVFARAVGGETDIVSKEMYSFSDNPDVADLEDLRDDVFRAYESYVTTNVAELFLYSVQYFIREITAAIKKGRLTLNQDLQTAFDDLNQRFTEFDTLQARTDEDSEMRKRHLRTEIRIKIQLLELGESVSLRPEATASVCRAYIEHGMQSMPQPVKLFYMGPMFRRERPQKGRYRQFYQIGAEVLEAARPDATKDVSKELAKDAAIDAEVIEMLMTFFNRVGLQATKLSINSIGHAADDCRRKYVEILRSKLRDVKDQLGADSQRRIESNPLRVLDSKLEHEQPIIAGLPHIADHLCDNCKEHYAELQRQLDLRGVIYHENWRLVRGLDYYMRTTFEITAQGLGSQNAVCGGGRYDGLVELLGGPPTKGIGFAIGEDRLIMSLESRGVEGRQGADVLIAWQDQQAQSQAQSLASLLREVGLSVMMPAKAMGPGQGIGLANKLGIPLGVVIGSHEVSAGVFSIKILSDGTQIAVQKKAAEEVGRLLLFRILLERSLSKVASNHGIPSLKRPVLSLLQDLITASLIPFEVAQSVKLALEAFNRAAHGETLTPEEQTTAISQALFVLYRMSVLQMMAS